MANKKNIEVRHYKPTELILDKFGNPRSITNKDRDDLKQSLETLGDFGIITIDNKLQVLAGNQRVKCMIEMGIETPIACKVVTGYTRKEKRQINITGNTHAGKWDFDGIDWGADIEAAEWITDKDINFAPEETQNDNEVPEPKKAITKSGDLWELNGHRVLCGDSKSVPDINRLLDGETNTLLMTDPPYGINIVQNNKIGAGNKTKTHKYRKIKNDDEDFNPDILIKMFPKVIIWGGNYFANRLKSSSCWLIWDKRLEMVSNNFADCEIAYTNFKKPSRIYRHLWNGMIRAGEDNDELKERVHPTQKPVGLFVNLINDYSKNEVIVDLYLGSGSTLIASEKTNRTCYGIEIDQLYCDVIVERWREWMTTNNRKYKIKLNGRVLHNG